MKARIYPSIAMVLLLGLIPAVATAAPPKPPFLTVLDWSLPVDPAYLPLGAWLSAWDINWKVPKAVSIELGYTTCDPHCHEVNEVTYRIAADDKYPQNLDLKAETTHVLDVGNCSTWQYVRVLDRHGVLLMDTRSPEDRVCIDPPHP